jgi:hypothetical protein
MSDHEHEQDQGRAQDSEQDGVEASEDREGLEGLEDQETSTGAGDGDHDDHGGGGPEDGDGEGDGGDDEEEDEDFYDDTDDESCPSCGDDTGSCRCFVVLSWEGDWLYSTDGELDDSSLDRILRWGHALSLAGAPPSRTCDLLAGLPESLAADIEAYWVEIAAQVDPAELEEYRKVFLEESRAALEAISVDPDDPEDPRFRFHPADARHPMHAPYLAVLPERFNDSVIRGHVIPGKRIEVHCTWAGICAEETRVGRHRSEGVGCSSIWETLDSQDPRDTWQRMEAMLEPVLAKLDGSSSNP